MRNRDKVSDELLKLYDSAEGRKSLVNLLMEHGSLENVDGEMRRRQTYEESHPYEHRCGYIVFPSFRLNF